MKEATLKDLIKEIEAGGNPERALHSQRFFKTAPGQYGEGDIFVGLTVPQMRALAKNYYSLTLGDIQKLLSSKIHERRFIALVILQRRFEKGHEAVREEVFHFYLANLRPPRVNINNWDLVDTSAPHIVGAYLMHRHRGPLFDLANSDNLWQKRTAIISTLAFIRHGDFETTLQIAYLLLNDSHDLIHKAVGWMLRELGNRDRDLEEAFLKRHYRTMPRTMLRYAIEKFPQQLRKAYLSGEVES